MIIFLLYLSCLFLLITSAGIILPDIFNTFEDI